MPELPEMEVLCRGLQRYILGKTIAGTVVNRPECIRQTPAAYEAALVGGTVEAVWRRGKAVIVDLSNGWSVLIHLALGGEIVLKDSAAHDPAEAQIVLRFTDGTALHAQRLMLGNLPAVRTYDIALTRLRKVGPDALGEPLSADSLRTALGSKRGAMKPLLVDQSLLSGIGNLWSDEILFAARVHPATPANALSAADFERLSEAIRQVLTAAVDAGGAEQVSFLAGPEGGPRPAAQLHVHGREGEPCSVCGSPIRTAKVSGKTAYLCGRCQRRKAQRRPKGRTKAP